MELRGAVALVTGGGGGLGAAICHMLAGEGTRVVPADVRMDKAEKVALDVRAAGSQAMPLRVDVSDEDSVEEAVRETISKFGQLDILVNNAGVDVTLPIDELAISDWDLVMGVNLRGPFMLSRLALLEMKQRRQGHLINIVSTAARRAWPNASAYHASKWGLLGLSHALHAEARQYGVKVTAVVAGGMRTPFLLDRFPEIDLATLQDPANVADTIRYVLGQPDETVIPEVMVLPMRETSWP